MGELKGIIEKMTVMTLGTLGSQLLDSGPRIAKCFYQFVQTPSVSISIMELVINTSMSRGLSLTSKNVYGAIYRINIY